MRPIRLDPLDQARMIVCTALASRLVARRVRRVRMESRRQTAAWEHIGLGIWIGSVLCAAAWLFSQ
ncbi:MAG TPA: hypothetical protein VNF68_02930 [Candidatus Baltobacteraceae bacterium]|nr:hypothetical protein [Candidatus Baltobacteraceae bacterium]